MYYKKARSMNYKYKSNINIEFHKKLNDLLFFNENQSKYKKNIIDAIELYGLPKIDINNDIISIRLDSKFETHTLFLFLEHDGVEQLLGLAVFISETKDEAILLHIAVDYKELNSNILTLSLILKVKEYLRNFSGMKRLKLFYSNNISYLEIN